MASTPAHGGLPATLPADILAELKKNAEFLSTPGKGFLASDESAGPWLRAGSSEAAKIPDTAENRAAYRSMIYSTPNIKDDCSGVILHWETLFQKNADGKQIVEVITENGMLAGIKLDKGFGKEGIWGTATGPLGHPEPACKGLDDLKQRAAEAYKQGARFAKWRNVLQIDPATGLPSDLAIMECTHNLARYASICQSERLVPIVEPEIVPNGNHDIYVSAAVTEKVLSWQFKALHDHHVYLEGCLLKPNMVKAGLGQEQASPELVAQLTVQALKRTVPSAIPGIFFLSGETQQGEDNEKTATRNLNAMNKMYPKLPWHLSFSFGKALQKTCLVTWMGKTENKDAAQAALKHRAHMNFLAVMGTYDEAADTTVGIAGNISQGDACY